MPENTNNNLNQSSSSASSNQLQSDRSHDISLTADELYDGEALIDQANVSQFARAKKEHGKIEKQCIHQSIQNLTHHYEKHNKIPLKDILAFVEENKKKLIDPNYGNMQEQHYEAVINHLKKISLPHWADHKTVMELCFTALQDEEMPASDKAITIEARTIIFFKTMGDILVTEKPCPDGQYDLPIQAIQVIHPLVPVIVDMAGLQSILVKIFNDMLLNYLKMISVSQARPWSEQLLLIKTWIKKAENIEPIVDETIQQSILAKIKVEFINQGYDAQLIKDCETFLSGIFYATPVFLQIFEKLSNLFEKNDDIYACFPEIDNLEDYVRSLKERSIEEIKRELKIFRFLNLSNDEIKKISKTLFQKSIRKLFSQGTTSKRNILRPEAFVAILEVIKHDQAKKENFLNYIKENDYGIVKFLIDCDQIAALKNDQNELYNFLSYLGNLKDVMWFLCYSLYKNFQPELKENLEFAILFLKHQGINPETCYRGTKSAAEYIIKSESPDKSNHDFIYAALSTEYLLKQYRESWDAFVQAASILAFGCVILLCVSPFLTLIPTFIILPVMGLLAILIPYAFYGIAFLDWHTLLKIRSAKRDAKNRLLTPMQKILQHDPAFEIKFLDKILAPLANIGQQLVESFTPYSTYRDIGNDLLQPFSGLSNILLGLAHIISSPMVMIKNKSFVAGAATIIQDIFTIFSGIFSIIATPLTYLVKFPIRCLITLKNNSISPETVLAESAIKKLNAPSEDTAINPEPKQVNNNLFSTAKAIHAEFKKQSPWKKKAVSPEIEKKSWQACWHTHRKFGIFGDNSPHEDAEVQKERTALEEYIGLFTK